jgi:hypothetical protein
MQYWPPNDDEAASRENLIGMQYWPPNADEATSREKLIIEL